MILEFRLVRRPQTLFRTDHVAIHIDGKAYITQPCEVLRLMHIEKFKPRIVVNLKHERSASH